MSRFLRFFRVFVVAIICGFSAFLANAANTSTITVCDDSSDAGNACVRFDSANAGAPTSFTTPLNNNTKLTAFPYKPGYGYAGHYTGRNCGGTQILNHLGEWTGNSATGGNIYACWVQLVPGGINNPFGHTKLFVLNKNGGDTVGNMWPNLDQPVEYNVSGTGYGATGRNIRFENRGDWVYLRCYDYNNLTGVCNGDVKWYMPRNAGGGQIFVSVDKFFWSIRGVQELPTRSGYAFGGMYSTSGINGGTQYCNANGNTTDINSLWNNSLPAFNTIYARWNRFKVNLSGNGVSPSTVYLQYGDNWYSSLDGSTPITALNTEPTNGNNVFGGYYTAPQCQGTPVVNADKTFRTDNAALTAITEDDTTIYPCWTTPATWVMLTINNQTGLGTPWKLYYPLSGCSILGYHTSQDCLNTNVVASLANWTGHWPVEKDGWSYGGHWTGTDGTGTQYIDDDDNGTLLTAITNSTTVYAKWTFSVSLPSGQTTGPNTGCPSGAAYCCVFGAECNAPSPTISAPLGQQFAGWACSLVGTTGSCARTTYAAGDSLLGATNNVNGATGITLTATWESTGATVVYKRVTLNPNGGANGTQYIYERYLNGVTQGFFACSVAGCDRTGQNCSCDDPTAISGSIFDSGILHPGNGFNGYYTSSSDGDERIDPNGYIKSGLYNNTPVVLYAHWLDNVETVPLDLGEHGSWGTCGVTSIQVVPGDPPLESQLSCVPTANTGWNFIGYYDSDSNNATQYYDANGYAVYPDNVWPISNAPTELVARYEPITHTVKYYCKKGNGPNVLARTDNVQNGDQYTVWNGAGVDACANTAASSSQDGEGSKLVGWGYGDTGNSETMAYSAGENFDSFTITGDMDLSMVQKSIYYVTLNHCNDSLCSSYPVSNSPNPSTVYFSNGNWYSDAWAIIPRNTMNPKPDRLGYTFDGYKTASGTTVVDNSGAFVTGDNINANDSTIYAQWTVLQRQITLDRDGGSDGPAVLWHQIDKWSLNQGGDLIVSITPPTKSNNSFAGYWIKDGGEFIRKVIDTDGSILFFGQEAAELVGNMAEPRKFYARWDETPSAPTNPNEYFAVTTTALNAGETFRFTLSAAGNFWIDWGDGTVDSIVRNWYGPSQYVHTYTSAAPNGKTIKIWGNATGYADSASHSTILFSQGSNAYDSNNTPLLVAGISGSLGALFPTLESSGQLPSTMPNFYRTFSGCSNLETDISTLGTLFSWVENGVRHGVTGAPVGGFDKTFENTGITGNIPVALFAGVSGAATGMFQDTFKGCTGIESIPAGLFSGVSGVAIGMFAGTFEGCTGIESIPANLFSTISATGNATGSADGMFQETFKNTGITTLPATLFGEITASGVSKTGMMSEMFANTPLGANTNYYIPKTLFISNNQPIISDTDSGDTLMTDMFNGTNLITDCSIVGLTYYQTDFDDYWGGKKICAPAAVFSCENPDVGGTPNGTLTTIWADQITGSTTLPAATNCTAPTHYTKPSTAYWACTGNSNCTGNPNHWAAGGSKPSWLTSSLTQSVNFYMEYTPNEYNVSLNANGGTAGSVTKLYETYNTKWATTSGGTAITSLTSAQLPTRQNWNFLGYWDAATDGNLMIAPDGTINASTTTLTANGSTWYAHWSQSTGPFTVTYLCGDHGTGTPGTQEVNYNVSMTLKAASVCTAATGYTFDKWKIIANGVEQSAGATYTWPLHSGSDIVAQWKPVETTITLDKHGGTDGTSALYTRWGVGVYRDSNRTQEMKTGENPLTAPNKSVTLTLSLGDSNASIFVNNQIYNGSAGVQRNLTFKGYYSSASSTTKYIESTGYITAGPNGGMQTGAGYTSDKTWHAQWEPVAVVSTGNMPVPTWAGHVFNGWWTTADDSGTQITEGDGSFLDADDKYLSANTTWYAHWTGCSHDFGSNPHASKTAITAVDGMCGYHITCDTDSGVPLGAGYSQHGGNDTTGAFDFYILPSSTDTLPGCSPRVYNIQYDLMGVSATLPQSGTPQTYTYGVVGGTSITGVPSSEGSLFLAWCTDAGLSSCVSSSPYYTIGATDYGDRIYYAKWSADCIEGYMKYNYDVTVTADYDNQSHFYPEGVCAPGNYVITCDNNCSVGETCNACLENILSSSYHFGQRYGVYSQKFGTSQETYDGVVGALGIVLGGQNYSGTFPFGASSSIRPAYSLAGIGNWVDSTINLPSSSVFGQNDYVAYMTNLAQLNGKTFGRAHYSFNGLWTHQTSEEEQYRYLPTVNDTTPWSQRNADGKALSKFFTSDATVYAHWIPDEYTITLSANGGVVGNVTVLKEKWNTGWSKDNGVSYQTAANFVALTDSERPVRTGHTFAGYYTERQTQVGQSCPGTKIVNSNGSLNTGASSSTGTVDNAKYFGANGSTLYACWTANNYYVTLKPNLGTGANGTSNNTTIYTKYMTGVYTNSARTDQYRMTPNPNGANPVTLPERYFTITYNPNYTGGSTWNSDPVSSTFNGYYSSATGGTPYIDNTGYITPTGDSTAQGYTVNTKKWYAQWTNGLHDLLLTHRNGYFMDGWYDAAENGNKVGEYMQTITPTSNMTLYAHWTACGWAAGDHSTAQYVNPVETDGNVCKYHITCDSGYTHNGDSQFDEVKYSASGTLSECSANEYTITYYDNPAYETTSGQHILLDTQGYTYNPNNPVVLNPELPSNALSDHRASSVQWCDADGNNCKTQLAAGEEGNKTFYAKWTCATGYTTYGYFTYSGEFDSNQGSWAPGTCAPSRYRIMCHKNCPAGETCNACLEDFNLQLTGDSVVSGYGFGNVYNAEEINAYEFSMTGLPVPVHETTGVPANTIKFTENPNYRTISLDWPNGLMLNENTPGLLTEWDTGNYKTFMEALANQNYNSDRDFGAAHYDFDGLWTGVNGGDQYINANGWVVGPDNSTSNLQSQFASTFFTSDTNVYAHWTPKKYQVILSKNASDAVAGTVGEIWEKWNDGWALTQNGTYNSTRTLSGDQLPTRTGYTFAGYFDTSAETGGNAMGTVSNGVWTTPSATATDANPATWYARWTGNQYTVTYNCGIGTGAGSTDTATFGQSYTPKGLAAAGCGTTLAGHYFNGWNVTPGTDIKPAEAAFNWNYMENKTFTARWVAKEYHITFDKNGGSGGTNEVWEHYGANDGFWHNANQTHITEITLPTWSGHTFAGYALTINGAAYITGTTLPAPTLDFGDTSNNSTVEITLVARWDVNTYNVQYNLGGGTTTLPVGYVPVEYITFTGTQVIDTGLKIKKGYEIQTKFYPTDTGKYVYGALSSGNSKSVTGYVSTSGDNWHWGNKAIVKSMSLNSITYTIVQNASALTVNGDPVAYGTQDNFETGVTLSIGKAHNDASGGNSYNEAGFQGRMYWFTIRDDNGNVVYHGVPVKNTANNQYGLCNIIDGTCLTASGINGATATLPATYNHGTATTVSGAAARANSVFNSWCSSPSSNCNSAQTIPATATGDKTFYAKWTCDAGYSYSSGGACVANNITLDWNENGGIGLTNGSCTYNGDLTLGVAPTYADHVFNGWKLANNTYGGASTTVNGGCVQAYTGVTSGTSTAITAQWCNACNPTNATCTLNANTPGTCSYTTSCNTGYHLSPDSQLNVYNTVCIPYTITYQSDGHGDGATDDVLYNSTFTTNDAKNSSQFNWANHIVTAWTTVSGGNFPNLGAEYTYNVQSDTVLKANWGQCHCTPGSHVSSCSTTSSDNACEVSVINCATGYTGSSWTCDGINCTASCSDSHSHRIILRKAPGSGGTVSLIAIDNGATSGAGVYLATDVMMGTNSNPVDLPTLAYTVTYNASNGTLIGNTTVTANATFDGYYDSSNGTDQYINNTGYITLDGIAAGKTSTTNQVWFAHWTESSVTLPVAYRAGYTLAGWWTTPDGDESGINRGNAGEEYAPFVTETLYAHWTQCEAGKYCPGVETVNGSTVYNQIHNCPTKYSNSAAGSTMISDCYLVLTPGKYVSTAGNGMVNCTKNYYCDDNTTKVYYSDETNDGRRTTGIRKSCATNAGSFSLTDGAGKTSINACYKNVMLDKRGGTEQSGTIPETTGCNYNSECTLPDASILQLTGHTFHGGWTDQADTDCNSTTRVFVVPDDVDTYYACRTTNSYTVTLKDGLDTNATAFATVNAVYGAAMPLVDSNGNPLTVPTKTGVDNTTYTFEGYYSAPQNGTTATQYYDYNLNGVHVWDTEGNGTLYARWSVTCDPGYYLPANAISCTTLCPAGRYCAGDTTFTSFDVPKSSSQGLSGYIAAGYYSTGGGTSATPTAAGNGCVSGSGRSCGVLGANYYSNGGGTNNAGACVTGQTCGACPTKYRSNPDTAKTVITQCTAACSDGQWVMTAENPNENNANADGCVTLSSNYVWSNAHTVAYGSASPSVSDPNAAGRHSCLARYNTPQTTNASDHDDRSDCTRTVPLYKNGGTTVDGAVWPSNVTDNGGTAIASATCAEGETCDFGNPANLLEQTGYTFQANWGNNSSCGSTFGTSVTTPQLPRYYACKVQNNYTLTYACGTGATGDAPNQQTNIHYGDTVSISGAGGCAKTGHTFAGWAVSGTSDVITATTWPHDITWDYDGSKTFTAQWTANTYSISYVGNGGTAGSLLPDGYTQLEYIQSDGNQYIVTNFTPSSDFKHTIVFEALNSSNTSTYIAGTVHTAGRAGNTAIKNGKISAIYGNNASNSYINLMTDNSNNVSVVNNKSVLVMDLHNDATNTITLNGKSIAGTNTGKITSTSPMSLFAYGSSGKSSIKLYRDTIEQNGALVHNYVPAQNSNGVVGLYDTVTGVFLTNLGNGSFTPGNPVTAAYPNQYTYGVGTTVTGGAVRANSVFQGWCRTESLTNCAAPHEITTTDMGDITLYAKWGCATGYHNVDNQCVVNEFTLVYSKNGHGTQNTPANQTCTYGQRINLAAALSETGWNFNGWTIAGENYVGGAPIICNEDYLGVTGGTVSVNVNVTADWSARCNKITLATNSNDATWPSGSITALYAKTRESGSTTDGKWYKDNGCTTEYTSADYAKVIPTRSGWAFRGFYAVQSDAADISATQTNGANRVMTHTGAPTSITGRDFINGLNANTVLYAGWARDCTNPVAHGTCSRTIGQNTTYTTTCATGYHYDPTASESTYNPICVPNTITIILDKNGGTGTCGGQSGTTSGTLTCNYDGTCNTPVWDNNTCRLTKTGKIFAGWNTAAGGTGTQYGTATVAGDVQNINDGTTTTTLYAVWQDVVCNVTNGTATPSVRNNYPLCSVSCNNGYGVSGGVSGTQHTWVVDTGQCNEATYDINYHYDAEHGGALASLLPEGDERVQYIQNAASTYVRTGVTPDTDNVEVNLRFYQNGSGNSLYLLQSRASSGGTIFGISGSSSGSTINATWNGGAVSSDISRANGHVYTVNAKFVNGVSTLYVRDETSGTEATNTGTYTFAVPSSPFGLFGNYGGNMIGAGQRVYSASIKVNGVVVMDYIPAVRNSVAGFYDVISGEFKGAYTGTLSAGTTVTVAHPNQYTYGTGAAVYGGATRANSVFEGWCRNAALTDGCTMIPHVIGTAEYGDKDLYAKWSCVSGYHLDGNNQCVGNTITINYQNGGHGGTPNPLQHTCVYGATRNLAGAMGEVGYAFVGWRINNGINNEVYDASENITCDYNTLGVYGGTIDNGTVIAEAQWDTVEYVVTYDCNTTWSNPTPESQYIRTGGTFRTRQNTCQNPGYRFVKWAVSGTSPQEYKNENEQFTWRYTENKTFSAVWDFEPTFTVTTTDIEPGTAFSFKIAAKGQFVVDWGDGNIEPFTNTSASQITKSHTFESAAFGGEATKSFTIRFGGRATGYNSSYSVPAIQFFTGSISNDVITSGTEIHIARIDGSLGSIFPTLGDTYSTQPRFFRTFQNAINMSQTMQSLAGLFTGISGTPMPYMFYGTFRNCPGLTGDIPADMFPINGAPATALFRETFMDCTGLTGTIPQTLFAGIQGAPKNYMFYSTFHGCTNLTGIPAGLFAGINGTPATAMFGRTFKGCAEITGTLSSNLFGTLTGAPASEMFSRTFQGCAKLRGDTSSDTVAIPAGMFGNLTGNPASYMFYLTFDDCGELTGTIGGPLFYGTGAPAPYMFSGTFQSCKKLSGSIPSGLFGAISGDAAEYMYNATFNECEKLTGNIPNNLFGSITGAPKNHMFSATFYNCKNLTGEIPSGLFGNINGDAAQYMFNVTFYNCEKLTGTIPSGLFGNITGTPKYRMFRLTFYSADRLTGYVPEGLFGSLSATPEANEMMDRIFAATGLLTTCPCGTTEVDSDFRIPYWQSSTSTNPSSTTYKVSCRVGLKPGEHWYNDFCTTECSDTAIDELHVGNLEPYIVLADKVSTVAVNIKNNDTICYIPLARGGSNNNLNVKYGNPIFHLDRPNDTPPAGFGQR